MGLTSTGFTAPSLAEIKAQIESEIRANISPSVDLSASSPMGQLVAIVSRQIRLVWEAAAALYGAMSPTGAAGVQADIISRLTGTTRREATASTVTATVNLDAGTSFAPGTLVAWPTGNPDATFSNSEIAANATGSAANVQVVFTAEDTGPVAAPSGTLVQMSPVAGWNSITNAADAVLGQDRETDTELLVRRATEVQAQGSTTVDAIRADISQNEALGVISVNVLENDTDATVDGIPPHAIEAIVYGPASPTADDDAALAAQIFDSKPAGILAHGSDSETVVDSQNNSHTIGFTRPTVIDAAIVLEGTVADVSAISLSGIKEDLAERAQATLSVGDNLDWSEVAAWAHELIPGIYRLSNVEVGTSGGGTSAFTNLAATPRQIIALDTADITLTFGDGLP